jgi:hypothetical protein
MLLLMLTGGDATTDLALTGSATVHVQLFVIATNTAVASTAFDLRTKRIQSLKGCVPFRMTDGGHCKDSLLFEVQSLSLLTDTLLCKLFNNNELNNN